VSTILKEVYDAFLEAGVSEEKASKAAEAVAQWDARFTPIETRLDRLDDRLEQMTMVMNERFGQMTTVMDERFAQMATVMDERFGQMTTVMNERFGQIPTKAEYAVLEVRLTRWIPAMAAVGGLIGSLLGIVARLTKAI